MTELETTTPIAEVDISSLDQIFNCPPEDITRPKIEEMVAIMRTIRARTEVAEKNPKPRASKKKEAAPLTSVEIAPSEDAGF